MTNRLLVIASLRGLVAAYAYPITFFACIVVIPAMVALAVLPYVFNQAEEEEEEEVNDDGNTNYTMMSTREWLAQRYVPCALEAAIVESIPLVKYTRASVDDERVAGFMVSGRSSSSSCVVCLTAFQEGEELKVLPSCQHAFHPLCIDPWFETHSTCPTCRSEVSSTSAEGGGNGEVPSCCCGNGEVMRGRTHVPLIEIVLD